MQPMLGYVNKWNSIKAEVRILVKTIQVQKLLIVGPVMK